MYVASVLHVCCTDVAPMLHVCCMYVACMLHVVAPIPVTFATCNMQHWMQASILSLFTVSTCNGVVFKEKEREPQTSHLRLPAQVVNNNLILCY